MAFAATTVWEVQGGGDDTNNGGGFDPGNANMATDLAATSATGSSPVVTSASYTFVAGDVGAYVFVKAGTNWVPGWYPITSVSAGAATLSAAAGYALYLGGLAALASTAAGCASTASPTAGTWSVDYSRSAAARLAFTDLAIDATTNTKFSSAAKPVGKNFVGNTVNVTAGTGFTVQRVQVQSTSGTVATCDKSLGTLSGTGGVGDLGGCLASPGKAAGLKVTSNVVFVRNSGGATPTAYVMTGTANTAGGPVADATNASATTPAYWIGYENDRTLLNTDAHHPVCNAGADSVACITLSGQFDNVRNIDTGNTGGFVSTTGITLSVANTNAVRCNCLNHASAGFSFSTVTSKATDVLADGCGIGFSGGGTLVNFTARNCTTAGVSSPAVLDTGVVYGNAGIGINVNTSGVTIRSVTAYGQTGVNGDGLRFSETAAAALVMDVLSYGNAQRNLRMTSGGVTTDQRLVNCASGGGGVADALGAFQVENLITLSADPFVSKGASPPDLRLNAAAGGGALCRGGGSAQVLPGLTAANARDVGAYQHADPVVGGPTYFAR